MRGDSKCLRAINNEPIDYNMRCTIRKTSPSCFLSPWASPSPHPCHTLWIENIVYIAFYADDTDSSSFHSVIFERWNVSHFIYSAIKICTSSGSFFCLQRRSFRITVPLFHNIREHVSPNFSIDKNLDLQLIRTLICTVHIYGGIYQGHSIQYLKMRINSTHDLKFKNYNFFVPSRSPKHYFDQS